MPERETYRGMSEKGEECAKWFSLLQLIEGEWRGGGMRVNRIRIFSRRVSKKIPSSASSLLVGIRPPRVGLDWRGRQCGKERLMSLHLD